MAASLLVLLYRASRPHTAQLGKIAGQDTYRDFERYPEAETIPGLVIFRFDSELFSANANVFRDSARRLVADSEPPARALLVDAEAVYDLDTSAADTLEELRAEMASTGVELLMARVHGTVRDMLRRSGLEESIGGERIYPTVRAAVEDYLRRARDG